MRPVPLSPACAGFSAVCSVPRLAVLRCVGDAPVLCCCFGRAAVGRPPLLPSLLCVCVWPCCCVVTPYTPLLCCVSVPSLLFCVCVWWALLVSLCGMCALSPPRLLGVLPPFFASHCVCALPPVLCVAARWHTHTAKNNPLPPQTAPRKRRGGWDRKRRQQQAKRGKGRTTTTPHEVVTTARHRVCIGCAVRKRSGKKNRREKERKESEGEQEQSVPHALGLYTHRADQ